MSLAIVLSIHYILSMRLLVHSNCKLSHYIIYHVWQSQVEIEHYSVAYFARITGNEAL